MKPAQQIIQRTAPYFTRPHTNARSMSTHNMRFTMQNYTQKQERPLDAPKRDKTGSHAAPLVCRAVLVFPRCCASSKRDSHARTVQKRAVRHAPPPREICQQSHARAVRKRAICSCAIAPMSATAAILPPRNCKHARIADFNPGTSRHAISSAPEMQRVGRISRHTTSPWNPKPPQRSQITPVESKGWARSILSGCASPRRRTGHGPPPRRFLSCKGRRLDRPRP